MEVAQGLTGRQLHGGLVEQSVAQLLVAEEHVLDDVEVVAQRQVLIDGRDPVRLGVARAVEVDRLALPEDLPLVGLPEPEMVLISDGLAGAVVAGERGDLAGRNGEVRRR